MADLMREFVRYQTGRVRHPDLDDVALFVELLLEWSPAEVDESAALLLYLVQFPSARDATVLQWATDLETGDRLWQGEEPLVGDLKLGFGPRPDPARLDRAIGVVERVLAVSPAHVAQAPRFMLAWLRWARGTVTIEESIADA